MENLNQKKGKFCNKCDRKCYGKDMFLDSNGICNFCNSIGTPCNICKKNDKYLNLDGICDYCLFNSRKELKGEQESTNNVGETIKAIFIILSLVFSIWWIYIQVQGVKDQPECPNGYHLEEDRMMINSGCVSDYK